MPDFSSEFEFSTFDNEKKNWYSNMQICVFCVLENNIQDWQQCIGPVASEILLSHLRAYFFLRQLAICVRFVFLQNSLPIDEITLAQTSFEKRQKGIRDFKKISLIPETKEQFTEKKNHFKHTSSLTNS